MIEARALSGFYTDDAIPGNLYKTFIGRSIYARA